MAAIVRRRETGVQRLIQDLTTKRRLVQAELNRKRARILRTEVQPAPSIDVSLTPEQRAEVAASKNKEPCSVVEDREIAGSGDIACMPELLREPEDEHLSCYERYRFLDALRPISRRRTKCCGRTRISQTVQVTTDGAHVSVNGVMHCGNIHGCPVCAAKLYARRAFEIDSMLDQWLGSGDGIRRGPIDARASMVTLTIRHGISHSMAETTRGVAECWRAIFEGRAGQALRKELQLKHYVRALEHTHGQNGWHPHLHVIGLHCDVWTDETVKRLRTRWNDVVERTLGSDFVPSNEHGVTIVEMKQSRDGRYVAKMGLELSGIQTKQAKGGNRTFWQVARDASEGDCRAVALWQEAQLALYRTRQLTWSRGTREFFELPDLTDEEIVEEEESSPDGVLFFRLDVEAEAWDSGCRSDRFFLSRLVGAALKAVHSGDAVSVLPVVSGSLARSRAPCVFGSSNDSPDCIQSGGNNETW